MDPQNTQASQPQPTFTPPAPANVPPSPPQASTPPKPQKGNFKVFIPFLLILAIAVFAYYWYQSERWSSDTNTVTTAETNTQVVHADLSEGSANKLPSGFPSFIPVEASNIKESYKVMYGSDATQYTVGYNTMANMETLWKTYSDIFLAYGYTLNEGVTNKELGVIRGIRENKELIVSIGVYGLESYVTINYTEKNDILR